VKRGASSTMWSVGVALAHMLIASGCVSSGTWAAWHRAHERIEELEAAAHDDAVARSSGAAESAGASTDAPAETAGESFVFASCDDVARIAVARNPGLRAPRERARAALAMARAEGALPAPTASVAVWDFPIGDPSLADREGMYMLTVAQELPPPDALDASARAMVEEARAALGELDEMRREIAGEAMHACADWAGAAATGARLGAWVELLGAMRLVVEARLSAGGGMLADVARLAREITTAERMIARTTSDAERARETLRAWLGVAGETSLGVAPALLGAAPRVSTADVLAHAFEHRGLLETGRADVAAAGARARAAEARASIPTFMFGGMYMQTPQMRAGLGLEFGMTLPWLWSGESDLAAAARAEAAAAEAEVAGSERSIAVEVRTAVAELQTSANVLETLRTREAPAAAFALDATAAAYGAGEGTLLEWLDAARAIRELEIEETEILSEILHALVGVASASGAHLEELGRPPLGSSPADGPAAAIGP
jgi:cobalt-zinc-cadmium efflux system outer membrane protein